MMDGAVVTKVEDIRPDALNGTLKRSDSGLVNENVAGWDKSGAGAAGGAGGAGGTCRAGGAGASEEITFGSV
jgi:hypothetical protein